ncbi:MAG: hypothetical protein V4546_11150 [Bacteroidota bacterium]|uniref:Uncharacterized protein n=1 Tax=Pedobacter cryotolerans TaxID=2571270 RepID=A0A4U1CD19_9SPHI|nr:hypothetical protein [Pedobacter cryotolerans]RYF15165.1 MAG: hypothetical protein EOO42_17320 [Flavobacteriales bacterium]TKC02653.1 hypothetical protein FA045_05090 [Pedobacter cryotolerans]
MNSSSLEITENQYCIKLSKDTFDLSLVRQLIKRIQAEELFFNRRNESLDDDIISRNSSEYDENFDRLEEK